MMAAALLTAVMLQDPADIIRAETPIEAAQWVASDLAMLPPDERDQVFYIWLPRKADASWHHALAFAVNTAISRAGTVQRPDVIANGWIQRWYIPNLVPKPELRPKVSNLIAEVIDNDPYFRRPDGSLSLPVVIENRDLLAAINVNRLPVMRADYALEMMLSSLDGGKYLELRGLRNVQPREGESEEENVLAQFGVFRESAINVDGDRRVGMWRSNVTFKARIVLALRGLAGSAWITDDIFKEDVTPDRHPIHNLIETPRRGSEIIVEMPNGFHLFLITDGDGKILDQAPPNLVTDNRIAHTSEAILQGGAVSCIRCHGDASGLIPCRNNVAEMLKGSTRVLIDSGIVDRIEAENEIALRFAGRDFDRFLELGQFSYEQTIDDLTDGEMDVAEISDLIAKIYAQRRYELVTPQVALEELGFTVNPFGQEAQELLSAITAPTQIPSEGIDVVDLPEFAQFRAGSDVLRSDWDRVFQIAFERVYARGLFEVKE